MRSGDGYPLAVKTAPRRTAPRLLVLLPALALTAGLVAGCSEGGSSDGASPTASASVEASEQVAENVGKFSYEGVDGKTALELLQEKDPDAQVQGKGENAYVTAIRGREADPETEFWGLYVDDELAQVGAGSLETKDGQTITWRLEEIEQ